jgi:hypothetical protein
VKEPDWARLRELADEMQALIDARKWTKAEYLRILAEAEKAANGDGELLEFVINEGVQFE